MSNHQASKSKPDISRIWILADTKSQKLCQPKTPMKIGQNGTKRKVFFVPLIFRSYLVLVLGRYPFQRNGWQLFEDGEASSCIPLRIEFSEPKLPKNNMVDKSVGMTALQKTNAAMENHHLFLIGDTSSNGCFSIVMSVLQKGR